MQHDQEQFELDIRAVKRAEGDLCISKNRDYGPFNIARAPGGPIMGLAVRLHDKVARLAHLLETGADPEHESVQDTFMDIANYGSIGTMIVRGLWPGVDEERDRDPIDGVLNDLDLAREAEPEDRSILRVGDHVRVLRSGAVGWIVDTGQGTWSWMVVFDGDPTEYGYKTDELERVIE